MKNILDNPIEDVGKILDDTFTSQEEINTELTKRLISDNASGSWIPKAIRPFLSVYFSLLYGYLIYNGLQTEAVSLVEALATTGAIVLGIVGFYFTGRNKLKIVEMQAKAAIKITELKTKADIKENRRGWFRKKENKEATDKE